MGGRLHQEEEGQTLLLSALMVLALIMIITIPVNLAMVTHQKMQAQNAVDAAAMSGAVWQTRGMAFTQTMNDIIWTMDCAADLLLTGAVICNPLVATPASPAALIAGNVCLFGATGLHAAVEFGMIPFRAIGVEILFPVICVLSGSEIAHENGATSIQDLGRFSSALAGEIGQRWAGDPSGGEVSTFPEVFNLPWYALGFELQPRLNLIGLHLVAQTAGEEDWPLKGKFYLERVSLCPAIQPAYAFAHGYFHFIKGWSNWTHDYYVTKAEGEDGADDEAKGVARRELVSGGNICSFPPSTWVVCIREGEGYRQWTAPWRKVLGGLGVAVEEGPPVVVNGKTEPSTIYGELGSVALASSQAWSEPVVMYRAFTGLRGWVTMTPVVLTSSDSLDYGICH